MVVGGWGALVSVDHAFFLGGGRNLNATADADRSRPPPHLSPVRNLPGLLEGGEGEVSVSLVSQRGNRMTTRLVTPKGLAGSSGSHGMKAQSK